MQPIIISLLLLIASPIIAQTQECKVQIFLSEYGNDLSGREVFYHSDNKIHHKLPYSPVSSTSGKQIHAMLVDYLNEHGFTTDCPNTRFGIRLRYNDTPNSLELSFSLYDNETHKDVDTLKIDTVYENDKIENLVSSISVGFPYSIPNLDKVIDSIRKKALQLYESNTDSWIETANQLVTKKKTKKGLFKLSQYPTCCPSYPKVRNQILTIFRNYVHNDHRRLLQEAETVWDNCWTETDARFIIALLNSETLKGIESRKAEKLLNKVSIAFPSLDINAHEDYMQVPELAEVVLKLAAL